MGKISEKKEGMRELPLTQKHLEFNLKIVHIINIVCTIFSVSSDIQRSPLRFLLKNEGIYQNHL